MHLKTLSLVAVLAAALPVAGCGAGSDPGRTGGDKAGDGGTRQVAKVVERLGVAARDRDANAICEDLFTTNLQTSIRRAAGTSCAKEVGDNLFGPRTRFAIEKVDVSDRRAVALVKDQEGRESSLVLLPEAGVWKIARIGSAADVQSLGS